MRDLSSNITKPARVPLEPARLRPFFFKMKLVPIKALDATANINPFELSDIAIPFPLFPLSLSLSLSLSLLLSLESDFGLNLEDETFRIPAKKESEIPS